MGGNGIEIRKKWVDEDLRYLRLLCGEEEEVGWLGGRERRGILRREAEDKAPGQKKRAVQLRDQTAKSLTGCKVRARSGRENGRRRRGVEAKRRFVLFFCFLGERSRRPRIFTVSFSRSKGEKKRKRGRGGAAERAK